MKWIKRMKWIERIIPSLTLIAIVIGVFVTIDQMKSANEIRLEGSRNTIFASIKGKTLLNVMNNSNLGDDEKKFLRALYAHYITVYRNRPTLFGGALSQAYVADEGSTFCLLLSRPAPKKFWDETKEGRGHKQTASKLTDGTNLSNMEEKWCDSPSPPMGNAQ